MKKLLLISILILGVITPGFSQDCAAYYAMKEGKKISLASYDSKNKLEGYTNTTILNVSEDGDGMVSTCKTQHLDAKGKEQTNSEYTVACRDGKLILNLQGMMGGMPQGMENMEMTIEGGDMDMPHNPLPGQTLPDAHFNMKASMNGMTLMNMGMNVTNRKVEAIEDITCPAGTFKCVKLSEDTETTGMVKVKGRSVSWFCVEAGMVRVESYDSKGALSSYQVLQSIE